MVIRMSTNSGSSCVEEEEATASLANSFSDKQRSSHSSQDESTSSWEREGSTCTNESNLDLDSLFQRLQDYKSRNEVAWSQLRTQRSVSSKEAHDVAAAARFRLRLDQIDGDNARLKGPTELDYATKLKRSFSSESFSSRSRLTRAKDSQAEIRRRKVTRPPPLKLNFSTVVPQQEVQSAVLPTRVSSRSPAKSFVKVHYRDSLLQRRVTISGPRHESSTQPAWPVRSTSKSKTSTKNVPTSPVPPVPPLSRSISAAATISSMAPSTPTGLSEDQLQREIELALREGREIIRGEQRRSRKLAQMLSTEPTTDLRRSITINSATENDSVAMIHPLRLNSPKKGPPMPIFTDAIPSEPATPELTPSDTMRSESAQDFSPTETITSAGSSLRRKLSLFRWPQKRSDVDDLIDLYMDDEQLEEPKRRPSKPRRGMFRRGTDPAPFQTESSD